MKKKSFFYVRIGNLVPQHPALQTLAGNLGIILFYGQGEGLGGIKACPQAVRYNDTPNRKMEKGEKLPKLFNWFCNCFFLWCNNLIRWNCYSASFCSNDYPPPSPCTHFLTVLVPFFLIYGVPKRSFNPYKAYTHYTMNYRAVCVCECIYYKNKMHINCD